MQKIGMGEILSRCIKTVRRSGSSLRVVIPSPIVRYVELRDDDVICFFPIRGASAGFAKIERIDEVFDELGDFLEIDVNIAKEIRRRKRIRELVDKLPDEISDGNLEIIRELERIRDELERSILILKSMADRSLHFTDANEYLSEVLFELESEREEEFQGVLDYVRLLRKRREKVTRALENLENWLNEGKIPEKTAIEISERLRGELELVGRRIETLRKALE